MLYRSTVNQASSIRMHGSVERFLAQIIRRKPATTRRLTVSAKDGQRLENLSQLCADVARHLGVQSSAVEITELDYIHNQAKVSVRMVEC